MLLIVVLFALLSTSFAEHRSRCGSESEIGTTISNNTGDDIDARYTIEWCSKLPDGATTWKFTLKYINFHNSTKVCPEIHSDRDLIRLERFTAPHSPFTEKLDRSFKCNVTCLSKVLDLVFTGCYMALSQLTVRGQTRQPETTMFNISNRFHSEQAIKDLQPFYLFEKEGDFIKMRWDLHYIPVSNFSVEISDYDNSTRSAVGAPVAISDNCTHETYSVTCRVRAPPPPRCLSAVLKHSAAWRGGQFFTDSKEMVYCTPASTEIRVATGAARGPLWWAVGALLVTLLALAALWTVHSKLLLELRERTLRDWTQRYSQYMTERGAKAPARAAHILLLYARDCEPAMRCVRALADLLEAGAPGQVLDLFAPECVRAYAPAPAQWLRDTLARADVAVVLLHTPALAALYDAQLDETALQMQEPLLGSKVQYRAPHFGDALLQLALRLLRDTAHAQPEYTKYYIATISELQADVVPGVATYRRYALPAHGAKLLSDLRLRAAAPGLRRLADAARALQQHARARPDYLRDELEFFDRGEL